MSSTPPPGSADATNSTNSTNSTTTTPALALAAISGEPLSVGAAVSAKYRGAWCEGIVKSVKRCLDVKVSLEGLKGDFEGFGENNFEADFEQYWMHSEPTEPLESSETVEEF